MLIPLCDSRRDDIGWIWVGPGVDLGRIRAGAGLDPGWIWAGRGLDLGWIWIGSGLDPDWIRCGSGHGFGVNVSIRMGGGVAERVTHGHTHARVMAGNMDPDFLAGPASLPASLAACIPACLPASLPEPPE